MNRPRSLKIVPEVYGVAESGDRPLVLKDRVPYGYGVGTGPVILICIMTLNVFQMLTPKIISLAKSPFEINKNGSV